MQDRIGPVTRPRAVTVCRETDRIRLKTKLLAALGVALCAACGERDHVTARVPAASTDSPRWAVSDTPVVRLGSVDGDENSQFSGVSGAVRDSAGHIYVADAGSSQVRVFDPTGRFIRAFGRAGSGPGEFKLLLRLVRCSPGTVATLDFSGGRFAVFSDSGALLRTYSLPAGYNGVRMIACAGTDTLVALRDQPSTVPPERGELRVPALLARVSAQGTATDTIATYRGAMFFFSRRTTGYVDVPLGPATMAAVGADRVFVGTSDRPIIEVRSFDGAKVDTIAVDSTARPITRAQRRAALRARIAQEPLARTRTIIERLAPELPQPETLPFFRELVADAAGNLWVRTYETFPATDDLWIGYRTNGVPFARVMLPADLQVTDIGPGYVLGVRRNEDGVEYVELYSVSGSRSAQQ